MLTGIDGSSKNPKTGPMAQAWILCADSMPMDAKRANADDAVCGDCKLRGEGGYDAVCYVATWFGPTNVWKAVGRGKYPEVTPHAAGELLRGRHVRLGAYGDPAAIPFDVWDALIFFADGWVGYTHQWKTCDRRFRRLCMASVDTLEEWGRAWAHGWRTFRIRGRDEPLIRREEFVCPASDEAGHRTTCQVCQLCRGTSSPARNVVIAAHGMLSAQVNFYRHREDALR